MQIEKCPKNVRCDTANCHQFATFNIDTSGHKRNICLCEQCFNSLFKAMQTIKKEAKKPLQ